ncbi:pickpocket protein 28-like [Episyrphus balteatus]|uniref:pickpocket protein 28-like n=1 Tax=Episyrphus balteatus TaxID=286459 RepID=UPI0024864A81|nr:pickpocket protein 28-like [Episyrphus balteatus]
MTISMEMESYDSRSNADSIGKRIKYGTPYQAFKGIFIDYLKESSIHGFKYVGEQKRSTVERIIWFCAVIVSISTCGYLIYNIWNERNQNPVLVTLDGRLTPVWEIPFPTITICPQIQIHNKIFNLTKEATNITEDEYEHCDNFFLNG